MSFNRLPPPGNSGDRSPDKFKPANRIDIYLAGFPTTPVGPEYFSKLLTKAVEARLLGHYNASLSRLDRAREFLTERGEVSPLPQMQVAAERCCNYLALGNVSEAWKNIEDVCHLLRNASERGKVPNDFAAFTTLLEACCLAARGDSLYAQGRFHDAHTRNAKSTPAQIGEVDYRPACAIAIADFYTASGKNKGRKEAFSEARRIALDLFGQNHLLTAHINVRLGDLNLERNDHSEAKRCYTAAINGLDAAFENSSLLVQCFSGQAAVFWAEKKEKKAIDAIKDGLKTLTRVPEASLEVLSSFHSRAIEILEELDNRSLIVETHNLVDEVSLRTSGMPLHLGFKELRIVGSAQVATGDHDEALITFIDASRALDHEGCQSAETRYEVEKHRFELAFEADDASEAYKASQRMLKAARDAFNNVKSAQEMILAFYAAGAGAFMAGQFEEACKRTHTGLSLLGDLDPTTLSLRSDFLALGGMLANELGRFDLALAMLTEVETLRERLPRDTSKDTYFVLAERAKAEFECGLHAQCINTTKRAIKWCESNAPDAAHRELAHADENSIYGSILLERGQDLDRAAQLLESSLNTYKNILGEDHRMVPPRYRRVGDLYRSIGEIDRAIAAYEKAHELFARMSLESYEHSVVCFNLAELWTQMGDDDLSRGYKKRAKKIRNEILATIDDNQVHKFLGK